MMDSWDEDHFSMPRSNTRSRTSSSRNCNNEPLTWDDDHYRRPYSKSKDCPSSDNNNEPLTWVEDHYRKPRSNSNDCSDSDNAGSGSRDSAASSESRSRPTSRSRLTSNRSRGNEPLQWYEDYFRIPRSPTRRTSSLPKDGSEPPLLEDVVREIAVYIIASTTYDFALIQDLTKYAKLHELHKYREIMMHAARVAANPARHMLKSLHSSLEVRLRMEKHCASAERIFTLYNHQLRRLQKQLQHYFSSEIIYPMVRKYKWLALTEMFYMVRHLAFLVKADFHSFQRKTEFNQVIADACLFSVESVVNIDLILQDISEYLQQ